MVRDGGEREPFLLHSTRGKGIQYGWDLYCRNEALSIFLKTLSYHKIGADVLARWIAKSRTTPVERMLDVGCGDGTFTVALFEALRKLGIPIPKLLRAFDPDKGNVRDYERRVTQFRDTELRVKLGALETASLTATYDLVVCSHSLYGTLENPALSDNEKIDSLRRVADSKSGDGIGFLSLAGTGSEAYKVKREVLHELEVVDLSVHGEELDSWLVRAGIPSVKSQWNSYMDVTRLMQDEVALIRWMSYFTRTPEELIRSLGIQRLITILRRHTCHYLDADDNTRTQMRHFPAETGMPSDETLFLPHREVFFFL
ncbi:class I SAM-dependent methyltransferase [Rhodopseudomonas palustris]|uniref:class I SAM-dependent methyltransferase n=1 Tax=Rhodopseudomonas palustris TaxID=1076 RepID=UPI0020CDDC1F|nr:class I SAM-dependent methyltransferase [Rhodopseudomonas palustris]MCP9625969.1 class I SAM-dependent methyltransferase [Rhodopseudomonas palustris]